MGNSQNIDFHFKRFVINVLFTKVASNISTCSFLYAKELRSKDATSEIARKKHDLQFRGNLLFHEGG